MERSLVFVLLFPFFLVGCATPLPKQVSVNDGVFSTVPGKSNANQVLAGEDKVLLVVLSKNTIANLDYLKKRQSSREKELLSNAVIKAHIEILDPEFPVKWIANSLKSRFGEVLVVTAQNIKSRENFDAVVVVDFLYQTIDWGVDDVTVKVSSVFYDADLAEIGKADAYRKVRVRNGVSGPSGGELFIRNHAVLTDALKEWDQRLDRLIVAAPETSPLVSSNEECVRSALQTEDLDLRKQAIAACSD